MVQTGRNEVCFILSGYSLYFAKINLLSENVTCLIRKMKYCTVFFLFGEYLEVTQKQLIVKTCHLRVLSGRVTMQKWAGFES